jgi:hypothetical protein
MQNNAIFGGRKRGARTIKKNKNKKNKIYVSIPCLYYDDELINTVDSCIENYPDVTISIAFIGNKDFYKKSKKYLKKYKNVKHLYSEELGVGKARILASSLYDNEQYFLQVDSHTLFFNDWGTTLIEQLENTIKITNNEKTIISGYPPRYERNKGKLGIYSNTLNYPVFLKNEFIFNAIPKWEDQFIDLTVCPLTKISANFMFGNKHFAKNLGVEESAIFWEEEPTQSVNLIDSGFSLAYPGTKAALAHRYLETAGTVRTSIFSFIENSEQAVISNYYRYVLDPKNKEKIEKYQKYAGVDLIFGIKEFTIPCNFDV